MESFGQKIKKALTRNLSKKHIERSTTNQSNHSDEKSDEPDHSPRIKGPKASVNKAFELVGCCITYTQIFKNAQGNELDPKRQGLNRDFGRVCVVTPEIAVIAIADGCGLQYWSEISAKIAANELVMYMQQSLERRNRTLSVNEVKKRLKKAVLEINDVLINARNPVTGEALAIAEQGGATTLMIAAVLPLETELGGGTRWGVVYLGMGDSELYLVSEPQSGMPQSVPSSPRVDYNETAQVLTRNRSNSDAPKLPGERRPSQSTPHPHLDEKKEVPTSTTIVVNNVEGNNKVDSRRMSNSHGTTNAPKEPEKGRSALTNSADKNRTQPKVDLNSNKTSNSAELPSRLSLSSEDKRKFLVHRKSKTDLHRGSNPTAIKVNPPVDSPPHSTPTPSTKPDKTINNTNTTESHWRKSAPPPTSGVRERSHTETEQPPSSSYLSPNNNNGHNNKNVHNLKLGTHQPQPTTKIWRRICGDNGTSRFLPFVGLGERHIPEPGFVEMSPGDILIACSDGLKESFPELRSEPNQPQDPIALELPYHKKNMDAHKAFETWCRELMIHSYCCHKENNTHPDDVTIAAIRISETIHGVPRYKGLGSKGGYPHVEPTEDVTKKIDPLFYSFVEDYWKADPLPLKASEYHVKSNKRSSKAYSWEYTDNDKF